MKSPLPTTVSNVMRMADTTFERHYSVGELAKLRAFVRETIRKLAKEDPDVVKLRFGKRANTRYSVPESAARRIHTSLLNLGQPG